nr:unnamed protein product [Digitaria exilis]
MEAAGKAPVSEHGETSKAAMLEVAAAKATGGGGRAASRGLAVLDFIIRFVAVVATVGSAIAMGTTNQTLPFFTQFLRFKAQYDDLPTLTYAMLALVTSAASAAAAIVYLAHKGNARANWFAICQQFDAFCERISGSLIGSFAAMALLVVLIVLSAAGLARR